MEKLIKIMTYANKAKLKHSTHYKNNWPKMQPVLKQAGFKFAIKDDLDFYQAEIVFHGLENKQAFETSYEKTRHLIIDLWDVVSNNERLDFINRDLAKIKPNLLNFMTPEAIVWIPFLSELFNNLYDHSMTIFEHKQYYHLFNDFKREVIDVNFYHYLPYQAGFSSAEYILGAKDKYVLYQPTLAIMYLIEAGKIKHRLALIPSFTPEIRLTIAALLLTEDARSLASYLSIQTGLNLKVVKRLKKNLANGKIV